jgi:hypothetical protein
MTLNSNCGERSLIVNIILSLIYFAMLIGMPPLSRNGSSGQLGLPKWCLDGNMGMGEGSDFERINGLGHLAWLSNFGNCIQL